LWVSLQEKSAYTNKIRLREYAINPLRAAANGSKSGCSAMALL
jgi:hypothetical protein